MASISTGEEKKRKEKENVVTTYSNYILKNKDEKIATSIYVFGRKISLRISRKVMDKFREVARIEGLSASKLAEKALTEYGLRHGRGNPNLPLTPYLDPIAPSPVRVLCFSYLAGVTNEGQVYCRRYGEAGGWTSGIHCYSCGENQLRKK